MKNACVIAANTASPIPDCFTSSTLGTRENLIPTDAFGRANEWIASITINPSRSDITTFVIRSTPFCNPSAHTPNESNMAIMAKNIIEPGLPSILLNVSFTPSALSPASFPDSSR